MANKEYISDELLAAYLDGNTNEKETQSVLDAMKVDPELREVLDIALQVEDDNAQIKKVADGGKGWGEYLCCFL